MLCYVKFPFNQSLSVEEHQYITGSSLFFSKKGRPKKQKNN